MEYKHGLNDARHLREYRIKTAHEADVREGIIFHSQHSTHQSVFPSKIRCQIISTSIRVRLSDGCFKVASIGEHSNSISINIIALKALIYEPLSERCGIISVLFVCTMLFIHNEIQSAIVSIT